MSFLGGGFGGPLMPNHVGQSGQAFDKVVQSIERFIHRLFHRNNKSVDNDDTK